MTRDDKPSAKWAATPIEPLLDELASRPEGLGASEAERRLARAGPNRLPTAAARSPLVRFLQQFNNVLIYVLLAASVVTALLGHWVDTGVIVAVVFANAVIGFVQEGRAEQALDAVRRMLSLQATVVRDGKRAVIPAENLVPGDVVALQSGDKVPADIRLIRARGFQVDEAALTGESLPVTKDPAPVSADAELGDLASMAFSGTLVTSGQALGVVVATGERTEIGRISTMLARVEVLQTPLLRTIGEFGRQLTAAIVLIASFTFALGYFWRGYEAGEMFMAAVGIAVAAIPEGLPAVITITLAIGVRIMARRNAIIRHLPAVETLGSVSTICSDKTGTLTRNELTAQSIVTCTGDYEVTGIGYEPRGIVTRGERDVILDEDPDLVAALRASVLCNDSVLRQAEDGWHIDGDPTEGALLVAARKAGLDVAEEQRLRPRTDEIPFESQHRFMATLNHDHSGNAIICLKGAPERVIDMCSGERASGEDREIAREHWLAAADSIAARGQRVLAIAERRMPAEKSVLTFDDADGMTLLCLFGLIDPPREEAAEAVRECRSAGIAVKMITGDHAATASAIAARLGLENAERSLTGRELDDLSQDELRRVVLDVNVFARTSPEHKLRLVEALQSHGQVVAMTGDGVNDAPALKRANIGVAMGIGGTEAAKEAAEMVLADDNFASIVKAVHAGRTVYDNLKKTILFLLPTNGGQAFTIIAAVSLGYVLPITPVQILWVNLITAVTLGLALAFEAPEPDVMRRPPRPPGEPILSGVLLWRIAFVSLLLLAAAFGLFILELRGGASLEEARTVAVNALIACEAFYLFSVRYLNASSFTMTGIGGSRPVVIAVASAVAVQLLFTYLPAMNALFGTAPIGWSSWARIVSAGIATFILVEIEKTIWRAVLARRRARSDEMRYGSRKVEGDAR